MKEKKCMKIICTELANDLALFMIDKMEISDGYKDNNGEDKDGDVDEITMMTSHIVENVRLLLFDLVIFLIWEFDSNSLTDGERM